MSEIKDNYLEEGYGSTYDLFDSLLRAAEGYIKENNLSNFSIDWHEEYPDAMEVEFEDTEEDEEHQISRFIMSVDEGNWSGWVFNPMNDGCRWNQKTHSYVFESFEHFEGCVRGLIDFACEVENYEY